MGLASKSYIFDFKLMRKALTKGYDAKKIPIVDKDLIKTYGDSELESIHRHFSELVGSPSFETIRKEWLHLKNVVLIDFSTLEDSTAIWRMLLNTVICKERLSNIVGLMKICLTISPHTVDCERGFSKQNLIKSRLRANLSKRVKN